MADKRHLARLAQGVPAWNQWRDRYSTKPNLTGANLSRVDLFGVDLSQADLTEAILTRAFLGRANVTGANLIGANLTEAILTGADFSRAILIRADLSSAHLALTNFSGANLAEANLTGANLFVTNFLVANLSGMDLHKVALTGVTFADVDLRMVHGLDTIRHLGPSTIGIDTLYRSQGQIPEVFLRGCGVPDEFITHVKSLAGRPFDYHSCFISYSSKDTPLAERLYADLQAIGVRCWFAPEDMKIGDKFRSRIDEAIHLHDKLLLILSKHSLESPWVEKEVETAFAKEAKEQRSVLFPVRVDQAIMQRDTGWAADIHRTRHIGDFRRWKNHDSYSTAFDRLLRDLKAASQ
jgi:TIR domain/Pentapeptide repeats (8 copies)